MVRTQAKGRCGALLQRVSQVGNLFEGCEHRLSLVGTGTTGIPFQLASFTSGTIPPTLSEWCFSLVKDALHDLYLPVWGWSDSDKRKQLAAPTSRFLIALVSDPAPPPDQQQEHPSQQHQPPSHAGEEQQGLQQPQQPQHNTVKPQPAAAPPSPGGGSMEGRPCNLPPDPETARGQAAPPGPAQLSTAMQPAAQSTAQGEEQGGEQCDPHCDPQSNPQGEEQGGEQCDPQCDPQGAAAEGTPPCSAPSPDQQQSHASSLQHEGGATPPPLAPPPCQLTSHPLATAGQPAAFVNYRFEAGYDGEPVMYIYEVMVAPAFQRQGLASHMLGLLEEVAWQQGMDKQVLTEFLANKPASALYRRCGFTRDKVSPDRSKGYEILSKKRPCTSSSGIRSIGGVSGSQGNTAKK
ncbi:hypothetical protein V8C86DRAFT_2843833 [Haematococcus lacustris]